MLTQCTNVCMSVDALVCVCTCDCVHMYLYVCARPQDVLYSTSIYVVVMLCKQEV